MVDGSHPPSARRRQRPFLRVLPSSRTLWSLAVLAMVLDIALTGVGLSMGLAERNLLARRLIGEFGLFGAGALLKGFALSIGYTCWRLYPVFSPRGDRNRAVVPLALALPSWAAVGINAVTILAVS